MPSRPAARHTSDRSPYGSAAATSSSRRVWSGSASSCRRKLCSIRPGSGIAPGSPNPPASSAGVSPFGSSSSASGLPCVSATIRSRTRRVQRPGQRRFQQGPGIVVPQPRHFELRQPGQLAARLADREHQADRVGDHPPGREPQGLRGSAIQPLMVIDDADQRLRRGHLREQAQHGQPDQEPVRRRPGADPEHGPQRIALRTGQVPGVIQHRPAQLMQPGEGQLHLRLHARRARHPAPLLGGLSGQVVEQDGLAHARLTADHQGAGSRPPGPPR